MARQLLRDLGVWLDRLERLVIVLCCAGIVILIFSGVLSRFVFAYGIAWSEELARYLFLWGALFGAAAACRTGQHGGIPLVVDRLPAAGRRAVELTVGLGVAAFLGYLAWQSFASTTRSFASGQISTTTHIPVWVVNCGMLLAFLLAALRTIQGLLAGAYRVDQVHVE